VAIPADIAGVGGPESLDTDGVVAGFDGPESVDTSGVVAGFGGHHPWSATALAHRDPGGLQIGARRLPSDRGGLLDAP
jgi:hypothetical protein